MEWFRNATKQIVEFSVFSIKMICHGLAVIWISTCAFLTLVQAVKVANEPSNGFLLFLGVLGMLNVYGAHLIYKYYLPKKD